MTNGRLMLLAGVLLVVFAPRNNLDPRTRVVGEVLILVGLVLIFFEWRDKRKKP